VVMMTDLLNLMHGSKPFLLRMVSGRVIEIPHPDFVAMTPERTALVLVRREEPRLEVIRINQIESIEVADDTAAA
jgi:hypothetical protein